MARYEFNDGKSAKFWDIEIEGDSFTVRYGRIGTDGQTSTKTFDSEEKAQSEADKLIKSKTKKGYERVAATDEPSASTSDSGNADLEQAIFEDPENDEAWQVYADWLQEKGDARGEAVSIDIAIATSTEEGSQLEELLGRPVSEARPVSGDKVPLVKRRNELFETHGKDWVGKTLLKAKDGTLSNQEFVNLTWKGGFIVKARLTTEYEWEGPDLPTMLRALLKLPSAKFLGDLALGVNSWEGDNGYDDELLALSKVGKLHALRRLHVGDFERQDDTEISWTDVGDVGRIWNVVPNLQWLTIQGGGIELGKNLKHDKLKELHVLTGGLPASSTQAIANAELPSLETLEVWFGDEEYGAEADIDMLKPLFESDTLPRLKHLGLQNAQFQNEIALGLCSAKIVEQLETLNLSMGIMTRDGAMALVEHKDRFKHLKSLNVEENCIEKDAVEALRAAFGAIVEIGDQEESEDPDDRYVSVGE